MSTEEEERDLTSEVSTLRAEIDQLRRTDTTHSEMFSQLVAKHEMLHNNVEAAYRKLQIHEQALNEILKALKQPDGISKQQQQPIPGVERQQTNNSNPNGNKKKK